MRPQYSEKAQPHGCVYDVISASSGMKLSLPVVCSGLINYCLIVKYRCFCICLIAQKRERNMYHAC